MNKLVLDLLRKGGYILYIRHGEATIGIDRPNMNFRYCLTQRNLSELGKKQAINYGEILRNLNIPISYPIITSPFCRTIETAQLAFERTKIQVDPFWYDAYKLSRNLPEAIQKNILDMLESKLEIEPDQGTNKVIVAHGFPNEIGLGQISNMGTVVIKPGGKGNSYEIVEKLSFTDFVDLQF